MVAVLWIDLDGCVVVVAVDVDYIASVEAIASITIRNGRAAIAPIFAIVILGEIIQWLGMRQTPYMNCQGYPFISNYTLLVICDPQTKNYNVMYLFT